MILSIKDTVMTDFNIKHDKSLNDHLDDDDLDDDLNDDLDEDLSDDLGEDSEITLDDDVDYDLNEALVQHGNLGYKQYYDKSGHRDKQKTIEKDEISKHENLKQYHDVSRQENTIRDNGRDQGTLHHERDKDLDQDKGQQTQENRQGPAKRDEGYKQGHDMSGPVIYKNDHDKTEQEKT